MVARLADRLDMVVQALTIADRHGSLARKIRADSAYKQLHRASVRSLDSSIRNNFKDTMFYALLPKKRQQEYDNRLTEEQMAMMKYYIDEQRLSEIYAPDFERQIMKHKYFHGGVVDTAVQSNSANAAMKVQALGIVGAVVVAVGLGAALWYTVSNAVPSETNTVKAWIKDHNNQYQQLKNLQLSNKCFDVVIEYLFQYNPTGKREVFELLKFIEKYEKYPDTMIENAPGLINENTVSRYVNSILSTAKSAADVAPDSEIKTQVEKKKKEMLKTVVEKWQAQNSKIFDATKEETKKDDQFKLFFKMVAKDQYIDSLEFYDDLKALKLNICDAYEVRKRLDTLKQGGGLMLTEKALMSFQHHTRMTQSNLRKIVKYALSREKRYAKWMLIYGMLKLMDQTHMSRKQHVTDRKCKEDIAKWIGAFKLQ